MHRANGDVENAWNKKNLRAQVPVSAIATTCEMLAEWNQTDSQLTHQCVLCTLPNAFNNLESCAIEVVQRGSEHGGAGASEDQV